LKALFERIAETMAKEKDRLIALDGAMGDGDLGLTMSNGFAKASEAIAGSSEAALGKLLRTAGMAMADAAPSTMGTLLASGWMRAGKALGNLERAGLNEVTLLFQALADGIMARGKAQAGEKTILDVLLPAAQALQTAAAGNHSLSDGLDQAAAAARQGFEESQQWMAARGRAAFYREQGIGKPDAGAAAGVLIVEVFAQYAAQRSAGA
jgi:dihydroxyacetone kinase-like protein